MCTISVFSERNFRSTNQLSRATHRALLWDLVPRIYKLFFTSILSSSLWGLNEFLLWALEIQISRDICSSRILKLCLFPCWFSLPRITHNEVAFSRWQLVTRSKVIRNSRIVTLKHPGHTKGSKTDDSICSEMLTKRFPLQVLNHFHSTSVTEKISLNSHLVTVLSIVDGCMVPIWQFLTHSVEFWWFTA